MHGGDLVFVDGEQENYRPETVTHLASFDDVLEIAAFSLLPFRRSIAGSMVGGLPETQEMLDFCAEHDISAEVEVIPADQVNEAYERVLASDVRYRFVIDTGTLA